MLRIIACSAITLLGASAFAQSDETGRELYASSYFARYAPQTASDMVSQVPGFTLAGNNRNGNNEAQRGLGQGLGNLLINGKRPSTKDDGPVALLERIPANQVLRIEILNDGSAELSGQSGKIVNVIATESETLNGAWKTQVHTLEQGYTTPKLDGSLTGKLGSARFTAGLDWSGDEFPQWGQEQIWDETDSLYELRDEISNYFTRGTTFNFSLGWDFEDSSANVSFLVTDEKRTYEESSDRYHSNGNGEWGEQFTAVDYQSIEEELSYEIGGDYTRPLGMGELKLIGLFRHSKTDAQRAFDDLPMEGAHYLFESTSEPEEQESILRSVFSFEPVQGHRFEVAGELVKNTLETASTFREDTGSGFEELTLDGSNTEVSEERAELSVQYSTALTEQLSFQASLGGEYSEISVDGTEGRTESFVRPKGFASFSWAQTDDRRIRARLERSVGQLDFYDFASSTNVNDGTTTGGNTQLVPDQTWRAELSLEQQFGDNNSFTVTVFREEIEDFITFIPMGDGSEGLGNISELESSGIDLSATINTQSFGIPGGKLDLMAEIHTDELDDPVTGERREYRRNGYKPEFYQLSFRQDFPQSPFAWGVILEERSGNINYRIDRVRHQDHKALQAHRIFVEHKDLWGMVAKLEVEDLFGFTYVNERTLFDGDRNGAIVGRETNTRHSPWVLRMSVSGTF